MVVKGLVLGIGNCGGTEGVSQSYRAPALAPNVVVLNTQRANPPRGLGAVCQWVAVRVHGAERILRSRGVKFADPPGARRAGFPNGFESSGAESR